MLVVDVSGLTGNEVNALRVELSAKDISLLTVKNSLARRACDGTSLEALGPVLEGSSTLVWGGEDIVALSREITNWAKEVDTLAIKGGAVDGKTLDAAGVDKLWTFSGFRPQVHKLSTLAAGVNNLLTLKCVGRQNCLT